VSYDTYKEITIANGVNQQSKHWYIDFKNFVDAVKLKMHLVKEQIKRMETSQVTYICRTVQCQYEYSEFEVMKLLDPETRIVTCKRCKGDVEETISVSSDGLSDLYARRLRNIVELLQELDYYLIPSNSVGRRNYRDIITKEEFQKRKYEEEKRYNLKKIFGNMSATQHSLGTQLDHTDTNRVQLHHLLMIDNDVRQDEADCEELNELSNDVTIEDERITESNSNEMKVDTEVMMVKVQGILKNINDITEEDQRLMNNEEYTDYYSKSGFADEYF
jgi:hypothetical protein